MAPDGTRRWRIATRLTLPRGRLAVRDGRRRKQVEEGTGTLRSRCRMIDRCCVRCRLARKSRSRRCARKGRLRENRARRTGRRCVGGRECGASRSGRPGDPGDSVEVVAAGRWASPPWVARRRSPWSSAASCASRSGSSRNDGGFCSWSKTTQPVPDRASPLQVVGPTGPATLIFDHERLYCHIYVHDRLSFTVHDNLDKYLLWNHLESIDQLGAAVASFNPQGEGLSFL